MARLESQIKLGYFKTPVDTVNIINSFLDVEEQAKTIRIIDPCCGTGEAIDMIATGLQKKNVHPMVYGVEMDKERAECARQKLTKVVCSDLFRVRTKVGAYGLVLLNPPYDDDIEGEDQRLEHKFLKQATPYLRAGGILIYLIPQRRLSKRTARYLASWYRKFIVCRFPGKSYDKFQQIVIFAIKKPPKTPIDDEVYARLAGVPETLLKELSEKDEPVYTIPKSTVSNKSFYLHTLDINMEELQQEVDDHGAWIQVKGMIQPRTEDVKGKVLMPLRRGHMAVLVSCGLCDGLIEKGKKRLLIKGVAKKEQIVAVEHIGKKSVVEKSTDIIKIGIKAIDLNSGELINVE
jgi:predicted RNA methylase